MSRSSDLIVDYYRGCNAADAEIFNATLTEDFVHYYLAPNISSRPTRGRDRLAAKVGKSKDLVASSWSIDRIIEQGDRAAIEYAMRWTPPGTDIPTIMRGCEWYVRDGGKISQVRSYHQVTATPSDLHGFDYEARGYSDGTDDAKSVTIDAGEPLYGRLPLITAYYDACNRADAYELEDFFTENVAHYFLQPNIGSAPVIGAGHLGRYWRKVARMLQARWVVESVIEQGDEAVVEWSMYWQPEPAAERIVTRGTEWYVFDGTKIAEIRSYHKQPREISELDGFDYAAAGYSELGRESSRLHDAAVFPLPVPLA